MVKVLKPMKNMWTRPKGCPSMFNTQYKKKSMAEKHAKRLKRDYGYSVAIVKTPKGWNVCTKITKKSQKMLRESVARGEKWFRR